MTALLELQNVSRQFGGVAALSGVSLTIDTGAVVGLIGPNGSGKTTLVNMISGVDSPTAGHILLGGETISELPAYIVARRGIARTFQHIRLVPDLTAAQNVALALNEPKVRLVDALLRLPSGRKIEFQRRGQASAVLNKVSMGKYADVVAGGLSYGDRRRIEIARALASNPSLLLLDEPAAGMTYSERLALRDLIGALPELGVTVVLIEHDMDLVAEVCDIVHVLDQGRLIASGEPGRIRSNPQVIAAYLGTEDA